MCSTLVPTDTPYEVDAQSLSLRFGETSETDIKLIQEIVSQVQIQYMIRTRYGWPKSGLFRLFNHCSYDCLCSDPNECERTVMLDMKRVVLIAKSLVRRNRLLRKVVGHSDIRGHMVDEYNYACNTQVGWALDHYQELTVKPRDFQSKLNKILDECRITIPSLTDKTYVFIQNILSCISSRKAVAFSGTTKQVMSMVRDKIYTSEDVVWFLTSSEKEQVFLSRLLLIQITDETKFPSKPYLNSVHFALRIHIGKK